MVDVLAELKSRFTQYYKKVKQHKKIIWFILAVLAVAFVLYTVIWCYNLIFTYPVDQVSQITNLTEKTDLINKYRTTSVQIVAIIAQVFGGIAILIGLYFAWGNLTTAREGQITERFTRAVDQLGNEKLEIRLGGIYALERIANESEKDYWPIMEILTAYVRHSSSINVVVGKIITRIAMDIQVKENTKSEFIEVRKILLDIQAVLTVIRRRKNSFNNGEFNPLNLRATYLEGADLNKAHLKRADLSFADLHGTNLIEADLSFADLHGTNLIEADLSFADLSFADLFGAFLSEANLSKAKIVRALLGMAHLDGANLEGAILVGANLERANLSGANLERAVLIEANLQGAKNLTFDQLSKVKTLYNATLDEELEKPLREKYPALFEEPEE